MQFRTLASLAGAAVLLAACGATDIAAPSTSGAPDPAPAGSTATTDGSAVDGPATSGTDQGPAQVQQALAFEAPLLDGGTFDGAVSGDVVLWFWAPW